MARLHVLQETVIIWITDKGTYTQLYPEAGEHALQKGQETRAWQVPSASTAHPLSHWLFCTRPWRMSSCFARAGVECYASFSEHNSPGSWMLTCLAAHTTQGKGFCHNPTQQVFIIHYNLRTLELVCTILGLFSIFSCSQHSHAVFVKKLIKSSLKCI